MECGERCDGEKNESAQKYALSADSVGQRPGKEREDRCGERITGDDDARVTRSGLEFPSDGRKEKGNELSVRDSKKENTEKNERDLPLERFTFGTLGHARILAQRIGGSLGETIWEE